MSLMSYTDALEYAQEIADSDGTEPVLFRVVEMDGPRFTERLSDAISAAAAHAYYTSDGVMTVQRCRGLGPFDWVTIRTIRVVIENTDPELPETLEVR